MRVVELWRYPVKSLQGEQVNESAVDERGLLGDRHWGLVDTSSGFVLTARRVPQLLLASANLLGTNEVSITLPDGTVTTDDALLSDWLERPVALQAAGAAGSYETQLTELDEAGADWVTWEGPNGVFHDSGRTQVSICSRASIGEWDLRRFRFNVIVSSDDVDGAGEDALVGASITIGEVGLDVTKRIDRCVMVTRPQPGGIERDTSVLKIINRERDRCLGIGAVVIQPGQLAVGDELSSSVA